ncbi:MAG TPA: hypothetical protein VJM33_05725 [Microthrixaceae bacterium]|nr:hypothetical protein [Microthrixaceae bacterium]
MSEVAEGTRPGPWVVASFVWLGFLLLIGISATIVNRVLGPGTYEAARVISVDEEALRSVEEIADSDRFQLELAEAAGVPVWEIQVDACQPGNPANLRVSVRHHDRRRAVELASLITPTLNDHVEGGPQAFPPPDGAPSPIQELVASSSHVVDPDERPRCEPSFPWSE